MKLNLPPASELFIAVYSWVFIAVNVFIFEYLFAVLYQGKLKSKALTIAAFTGTVTLICILNRTFILDANFLLYLFLNLFTFWIGLRVFHQGSALQHFVGLMTVYVIAVASEAFSYILLNYATSLVKGGYWSVGRYDYPLMAGTVYCNMLFLVMTSIAIAIYKAKTEHTPWKYLLQYIYVPIYQMLLLTAYFSGVGVYNWYDMVIGALIMIFSMAIDAVVMSSLDSLIQKIRLEEQMTAIYRQRQLEVDYQNMTAQHICQMEQVKNELAAQMKKAYELLETDASDVTITGVLDASLQNLQSTRMECYCENHVVNSVLTVKKEAALRNDIEMKIATNIPDTLPIEKIDLCSLYSNLLDNAIEAARQIKDDSFDKAVVVKSDVQAGFLMIKVENTKTTPVKRVGKTIKTSKKDEINHGLGLQLVHRIAEKYDGLVHVDYNDMYFSIRVSLQVGLLQKMG